MTTTLGTNSKRVLFDSDGIIAFFSIDDASHARAEAITKTLAENKARLFCCSTTLAEVMTSLQRKFGNRPMAQRVFEGMRKNNVEIIPVDGGILDTAYEFFLSSRSKRNTIFDAINIAAAKKYQMDAIFSFDTWYPKHGLSLA